MGFMAEPDALPSGGRQRSVGVASAASISSLTGLCVDAPAARPGSHRVLTAVGSSVASSSAGLPPFKPRHQAPCLSSPTFTTVTHPRCSRSSTAAQDCDCPVCAWCGATDPAPVSPHPAPSVAFAVDLGSAHHSAHAWSHAQSGGLRSVLTQPQRADSVPDHRSGGCPMPGWYEARAHVCKRRHTAHLLLRTERKSRPNAPQPPSAGCSV